VDPFYENWSKRRKRGGLRIRIAQPGEIPEYLLREKKWKEIEKQIEKERIELEKRRKRHQKEYMEYLKETFPEYYEYLFLEGEDE
jgi:hypothetical protein